MRDTTVINRFRVVTSVDCFIIQQIGFLISRTLILQGEFHEDNFNSAMSILKDAAGDNNKQRGGPRGGGGRREVSLNKSFYVKECCAYLLQGEFNIGRNTRCSSS